SADRGAPYDGRRLAATTPSAAPYLRGVDLAGIRGSGPARRHPTACPLVGPTPIPAAHVAAGHGMWGVPLGPVTGKLLARAVVSGEPVPELAPSAPLRFGPGRPGRRVGSARLDRNSTRLNSSHVKNSYAVFCS